MTFEFMYGNQWYKYENGWIHKKGSFIYYDRFCPVLQELNNKIEIFSTDQLKAIMKAILHSYSQGKVAGKKEKIQEFKRVFQLD